MTDSLERRGLGAHTMARVELGRTGVSLPTTALLHFQLAHAQARDAVQAALDVPALMRELQPLGLPLLALKSAARDRTEYLRRPDAGRRLTADAVVHSPMAECDVAFVIADGLSALAVQRHAAPLLQAVLPRLNKWKVGLISIVEQGRVAIGDEIGAALGAKLAVVLIGERPGLSSPDSLGIYITWQPRPGRTDAERNCISNVRAEGLSYDQAAERLGYLLTEARRRQITGIALKDAAPKLLVDPA